MAIPIQNPFVRWKPTSTAAFLHVYISIILFQHFTHFILFLFLFYMIKSFTIFFFNLFNHFLHLSHQDFQINYFFFRPRFCSYWKTFYWWYKRCGDNEFRMNHLKLIGYLDPWVMAAQQLRIGSKRESKLLQLIKIKKYKGRLELISKFKKNSFQSRPWCTQKTIPTTTSKQLVRQYYIYLKFVLKRDTIY